MKPTYERKKNKNVFFCNKFLFVHFPFSIHYTEYLVMKSTMHQGGKRKEGKGKADQREGGWRRGGPD